MSGICQQRYGSGLEESVEGNERDWHALSLTHSRNVVKCRLTRVCAMSGLQHFTNIHA